MSSPIASLCARCPARPDVVIRRGEEYLCIECVNAGEPTPAAPKKRASPSTTPSEELVAKSRRVREELEQTPLDRVYDALERQMEQKDELKEAAKVVQLMRMRLSGGSGTRLLRLIESDLEANDLYRVYLKLVWRLEYQ